VSGIGGAATRSASIAIYQQWVRMPSWARTREQSATISVLSESEYVNEDAIGKTPVLAI
jgi:hypothetical protein